MDASYKPNSDKSKRQQRDQDKQITPVPEGSAKPLKKGTLKEVADTFFNRDVHSIKKYVLMDILIPSVKKAISDIVRNGIDMWLFGEARKDRRDGGVQRVSYRDYYDGRQDDGRRQNANPRVRTGHSYEEIAFTSRDTAEFVLDQMLDIVGRYGIVTVADFFDIAGYKNDNFTNNKYGWTEIPTTPPRLISGGDYVLDLPRPMPIDR